MTDKICLDHKDSKCKLTGESKSQDECKARKCRRLKPHLDRLKKETEDKDDGFVDPIEHAKRFKGEDYEKD